MNFHVAIHLAREGFSLDASISDSGDRIGLFGPSGAGKTTLVRSLAGLERAEGRVAINGDVWQDHQPSLFLPAHRRKVGWVPQSAALFPHLSVDANLRFSADCNSSIHAEVVEILDLGAMLKRLPETLSGGEQKRVALGRALLANPRLLLLDEPLAGLDWPRKTELLSYLLRVLERFEIPAILVSHDPFEIGVFCERVWLIESGRIIGIGTPEDVFLRPEDPSQAMLAGIENTWKGKVKSIDGSFATISVGGQALTAEASHTTPGSPITVVLAAAEVLLSRERPAHTSARNIWPGRIIDIQQRSREITVHLECGTEAESLPLTALITPAARSDLELELGDQVYGVFKATAIRIFPH